MGPRGTVSVQIEKIVLLKPQGPEELSTGYSLSLSQGSIAERNKTASLWSTLKLDTLGLKNQVSVIKLTVKT